MQQLLGKSLKIQIQTNYSDKTIHNIKIHFGTHHKNKYMTSSMPRIFNVSTGSSMRTPRSEQAHAPCVAWEQNWLKEFRLFVYLCGFLRSIGVRAILGLRGCRPRTVDTVFMMIVYMHCFGKKWAYIKLPIITF